MNEETVKSWSVLKPIAGLVSILFHPLFLYSYMILIILKFTPYFFNQLNPKEQAELIVLNIVYTTIFPIISILLMKALGLIKSIQMEDKKDRIAPFIATAIFYSWTYINVKNSQLMPDMAVITLLGVLIGLYFGFFVNNFEKISIHGLGTGGLMAFAVYYQIKEPFSFVGPIGESNDLIIYTSSILLFSILVFALVGWARLYLNKHSLSQVLKGNLLGIFGFAMAIQFG